MGILFQSSKFESFNCNYMFFMEAGVYLLTCLVWMFGSVWRMMGGKNFTYYVVCELVRDSQNIAWFLCFELYYRN